MGLAPHPTQVDTAVATEDLREEEIQNKEAEAIEHSRGGQLLSLHTDQVALDQSGTPIHASSNGVSQDGTSIHKSTMVDWTPTGKIYIYCAYKTAWG